jgi:hypothetical protein
MLALLLSMAFAAEPKDIVAALTNFNEHARFAVPIPGENDLERMVKKRVVRIRHVSSPDEPQQVIGYYVMSGTMRQVWISARDPHSSTIDDLIDQQVQNHGKGREVWYQHMDLPWPFVDRHWLLDVADNHAAAKAGVGWEHYWELSDNGPERAAEYIAAGGIPDMTTERAAPAIYVNDNVGAYFVAPLPNGESLFCFHAKSTVGGNIPDRLIADYTAMTMNKYLTAIEKRIDEMEKHYADPSHKPIFAGDGSELSKTP